MATTLAQPLTSLYEADETAWLEAMARLAAQRRGAELDYEHLAEFLTDMAKRDRREVESRLAVLVAHLLKWDFQPGKRSRSWLMTVEQQRQELRRLFGSRTLRNHAEAALPDVYADAVQQAAIDTGLPASTFPADYPYTLVQIEREAVVGDSPAE